jgi:hypothetical protein
LISQSRGLGDVYKRQIDPVYRKYYKDKANEYFNRSL